jgi:hypothetical protein
MLRLGRLYAGKVEGDFKDLASVIKALALTFVALAIGPFVSSP